VTSRTLLAHVVSKFASRQWENVATESLHYLLDRKAAGAAVNSLLAPLGFDPGSLVWRTQASSFDDSSIPDLVGNDAQDRHVLIVEGKFWASLTENQPLGYLERQALQFPDDPAGCLLLFLVPKRRENVITAELEQRLGERHSRVGPFPVITDSNGRRVVVVLWSQMLAQLQVAFEAAHDSEAVDDLAQLRGLCDRADSEQMLPITPEEIGSERGHRFIEFCDIVDQVADALVADGTVSKKGLGQASSRGWWGRYVRAASGHVFLIGVLAPSWATVWPTPWWLVFNDSGSEVSQALGVLADDPRTPFDGQGRRLAAEDRVACPGLGRGGSHRRRARRGGASDLCRPCGK
jgi:hypothetical protein